MMIYHTHSLVGAMLWTRYALLRGAPLTSLAEIYAKHLESPGTKAYTVAQTRAMLTQFSQVSVRRQLSFGDLLLGSVGQRHGGIPLTIAKLLYPRPIVRALFRSYGLYLLIECVK